jgi:hypothetical protein
MPRLTIVLLLMLSCAPVWADDNLSALAQCAASVYDNYSLGMVAWEKGWARSVSEARPELGEAAQLRADAQTLALQRDGLRIHYLAGSQPAALDLDETVAALRLFDWPGPAELALRKSQPDYATLTDQTEQAQRQAESHPRREDLDAYFQQSFASTAGAATVHALHETLEQGNAALDACRRQHPPPPPKPIG